MIWITGDCHGGFQRFGSQYFPQQKEMTREDYVLIAGDFGGIWDGTAQENFWLDWLDEKPFTTLFVDGNHENYTMLNALPQEKWHGGKVHAVRPHVLHLMRGQVFDIGGFTWFTMGGAQSHDIEDGILDPTAPNYKEQVQRLVRQGRRRYRVLGQSWWPEELPNEDEYAEAVANLEKAEWCVDCVLTHCAPTHIVRTMERHNTPDKLTDFLETVSQRCQFAYWFLGHYHRNQVIEEKYILQWEQMCQIQ